VTFIIDAFESVRDFFESGGSVLYAIFAVTVLMWALIIERFWFFRSVLPEKIKVINQEWTNRKDRSTWASKRIREQMISEASVDSNKLINLIKASMAVLPLLGLLGTVLGMINVFEVMSYTGTGNARAMAGGIYKATLPTMAGLVAAISGLYPASYLDKRAGTDVEQIEDLLEHH